MRATSTAATGHDGPGTQRPGHLQQHRQHAHHRLQAPACRVPGPALRERAPRRRADLADQGNIAARRASSSAPASRPSPPRASMTQGNMLADRQGPRSRHPRRRLLPDPDAGRPHRLYPRRLVRARRARAAWSPRDGYRGAARHHHPAERHRRHRSTRRARSRPSSPARRRRSMLGQLQLASFVNKAGLAGDRRQPVPRDAGIGPAAARRRRTPTASATCMQGYLEQANVEAVSEISDLITAQRAYEMNSKVITRRRPDAVRRPPSMLRLEGFAPCIAVPSSSHLRSLCAPCRFATPSRASRHSRATRDGATGARPAAHESSVIKITGGLVRIGDLIENAVCCRRWWRSSTSAFRISDLSGARPVAAHRRGGARARASYVSERRHRASPRSCVTRAKRAASPQRLSRRIATPSRASQCAVRRGRCIGITFARDSSTVARRPAAAPTHRPILRVEPRPSTRTRRASTSRSNVPGSHGGCALKPCAISGSS